MIYVWVLLAGLYNGEYYETFRLVKLFQYYEAL